MMSTTTVHLRSSAYLKDNGTCGLGTTSLLPNWKQCPIRISVRLQETTLYKNCCYVSSPGAHGQAENDVLTRRTPKSWTVNEKQRACSKSLRQNVCFLVLNRNLLVPRLWSSFMEVILKGWEVFATKGSPWTNTSHGKNMLVKCSLRLASAWVCSAASESVSCYQSSATIPVLSVLCSQPGVNCLLSARLDCSAYKIGLHV